MQSGLGLQCLLKQAVPMFKTNTRYTECMVAGKCLKNSWMYYIVCDIQTSFSYLYVTIVVMYIIAHSHSNAFLLICDWIMLKNLQKICLKTLWKYTSPSHIQNVSQKLPDVYC